MRWLRKLRQYLTVRLPPVITMPQKDHLYGEQVIYPAGPDWVPAATVAHPTLPSRHLSNAERTALIIASKGKNILG